MGRATAGAAKPRIMGFGKLILRSLFFHWRIHAGAALGAAVGAAVLVGALVVGDSVRDSLRDLALARLGRVDFALPAGDRFFQDDLAARFAREAGAQAAALIQVAGTAANQDETLRANQAQILGVTAEFWKLASSGFDHWPPSPDSVFLNEALAARLQARAGDTVLLRIEKPSMLSREAPISPQQDYSISARLRVQGVVTDAQFGRFGLQANQASPLNAFLPLEYLQSKLSLEHKANLLLSRVAAGGGNVTNAQAALTKCWRLQDGEAELRPLPQDGGWELRSSRVFLDPPLAAAARQADPKAGPILTYFVNELADGTNTTPYSMVTAMGGPIVPAEMKNNEIILNQWVADDLRARVGDKIGLKYYSAGDAHRLVEKQAEFTVRAILPLAGAAADRTLMPDFPGLAKAEKTENWDAGFPIKMNRIRAKDEKYWKDYRGSPKAFITLAAGTNLWANRFGEYTAVRFPGPGGRDTLEKTLLSAIPPAALGLSFQPIRERALRASGEAQDFSQLFLGFSLFLIVAALLLMALLYRLGLEQRSGEIGTLLALGFRPNQVRRLLLGEGAVVSALGGLAGMAGGAGYAAAMLYGLKTVWRSAVGTSALQFHAGTLSVLSGGVASVVIGLGTIWLAVRGCARQPARELLNEGAAGGSGSMSGKKGRPYSPWIALTSFLAAIGITIWGASSKSTDAAGAFFGSGALLLIAGLSGLAFILRRMESTRSAARLTITGLGMRACARRRKRSLATAGLLACGSFLVVAVGANKLDALKDSEKRSSGTGGFALFGDTTFPVVQDLNEASGRDFFALDAKDMDGVGVVSLRVHAGDDASCLNLNHPQSPRLLGLRPESLASRGAFTFTTAPGAKPGENPWLLLQQSSADGAIPAVGDDNTLEWALHLSVGDTLDYVDERGRPFKIRIVASIANSILQGSLLIDEKRFLDRFPSETGSRMFLIDAPSNRAAQVEKTLNRALQDAGLALVPCSGRLAEFNAVENTYLNTFQILGSLGLLLGSAGLGVVVLRNVLERRKELGVLQAIGFEAPALRWMVLSEHGALLALGLGLGIGSAIVAVLPAITSPGSVIPYFSLATTLVAIFASGLLWTWAATRLALKGRLVSALTNN